MEKNSAAFPKINKKEKKNTESRRKKEIRIKIQRLEQKKKKLK